MLRPIARQDYGWGESLSPEDRATSRLALLRWHSLADLTDGVRSFWQIGRGSEVPLPAGAPPFEPLTIEVERLLADRGGLELGAAATAPAGREGAGGGARFGGRKGLRSNGGSGTEKALAAALAWLAAHQSPQGNWDGDGFGERCGEIGEGTCPDPGYPVHDVGLTGLALLAFLGDGSTTRSGPYQEVVSSAVTWLCQQQNGRSGHLGERASHDFLYNHIVATYALAEAYHLTREESLGPICQRAVDYLLEARNQKAAWRYDVPPTGDNDTSITAWAVMALLAARDAGLRVDAAAFQGALDWFDEATDPELGRVGYDARGGLSARTPANEHFPRKTGEAMTAAALLARLFLDQDPKREPVLKQHGDLIVKSLPHWDAETFGSDMYYWYYGTLRHVPAGRQLLEELELRPEGGRAVEPATRRRRRGLLGPDRRLGLHRRPRLLHGHHGAVPGGVLPLSAPLGIALTRPSAAR